MTKQDTTFIGIVADSSGSMQHLIPETVGSINNLIKEQQAVPGEAFFSLLVFDYKAKWLTDFVNIKDIQPITAEAYYLGGMTALYDATAEMIIKTGDRLEAIKEEDRPSKVVIVIITDGEENNSHEYHMHRGGLERLQALIKQQKEKYNWQFMFLGADINAQSTGVAMGVGAASAMSYDATKKGMVQVYATTNSILRNYRTSNNSDASLEISDKDREANALDGTK